MFSQTYLYKWLGFKNYYLRMRIPLDLQYLYDDRQKTVDKVKSILREFQDCVGKKPADAFTKTDVIAYRDYLLDVCKRKPKTVDAKLTLPAAVFNVTVNDSKLSANPASRIRVPKPCTKVNRLPFELSELQTLFNSAIYTEGFRPRGGKGVWMKRWRTD